MRDHHGYITLFPGSCSLLYIMHNKDWEHESVVDVGACVSRITSHVTHHLSDGCRGLH